MDRRPSIQVSWSSISMTLFIETIRKIMLTRQKVKSNFASNNSKQDIIKYKGKQFFCQFLKVPFRLSEYHFNVFKTQYYRKIGKKWSNRKFISQKSVSSLTQHFWIIFLKNIAFCEVCEICSEGKLRMAKNNLFKKCTLKFMKVFRRSMDTIKY